MDEVKCTCGRLLLKVAENSIYMSTPASFRISKVDIICPKCKQLNAFDVADLIFKGALQIKSATVIEKTIKEIEGLKQKLDAFVNGLIKI